MRKRVVRFGVVLAMSVALSYGISLNKPTLNAKADVTEADINEAKTKSENVKKEIEDTKQKLAELKSKASDMQTVVDEIDKQIGIISNEIYNLDQALLVKEGEISTTEAKLLQAKEDEAKQYADMKLRIQYMYETGQTTYLEAFLTSSDIGELLNQTEYIKNIADYDKKMMDKLVATKNLIADTDARLKQEKEDLELLKATQEESKAAAEALLAAKQEELDKINSDAEQMASLNARLEKEQAEADRLIDELIAKKAAEEEAKRKAEEARRLAEGGSSSTSTDYDIALTNLRWPLPSSCNKITELFGPRIHPVTKVASYHYAVDVSASTGTPIYAAEDGEVLIAEKHWSYGNYVLLYHDSHVSTLYAHGSRILVSPGQHVNKGDVIMLVGSTGQSTGPHLHYEIRVDGTRVDPLKYYDTSNFLYYLD
ncbi:MAG TPA: peptidase M23 [Eubacterium sp.]|nr:peptidase M23 [Eubacterium sp.]